ncbi:MAG: hypothetical protein V4547_16485 [Bacteroidota bacterium]
MLNNGMTILIVGDCGSGKTWVMKQLIEKYKLSLKRNLGTLHYVTNNKINLLGKYDEEHTFSGSDRLSMSVMLDVPQYYKLNADLITVAEGDRFTNKNFIEAGKAFIIRIEDNGSEGRKKRGSTQTDRHIKSIHTRVRNIEPNLVVQNSTICLQVVEAFLNEDTALIAEYKETYFHNQQQLDLFQ